MKKLLLLLFFVSTVNLFSQVNQNVTPYRVCSIVNIPNFAIFDLTTKIPEILQGENPSDYIVTFHTSSAASLAGTDPITTPTSFTNMSNPMVIYARVVTAQTGDLAGLTMFDLQVDPAPIANAASLFFCDMMELPIYNLEDANNQIVGGQTGVFISYHETMTDAEIGANPIGPGYIPTVNPGAQTLFARVSDLTTGCFAITTLTLNTHNCGNCTSPTNLYATNITDTTFTLGWNSQSGVGYHLVSIVPLGSPASDQNAVVVTSPSFFTFAGLSPNTCYSVYAKSVCNPASSSAWSTPLNICMPSCTNSGDCDEALALHAFLDTNNNGVKDTGEENFSPGNFVYQINDSGTNLYGASNNEAYYIFDSNAANSYDISFAVNSDLGAFYTSAVVFENITIPTGSGLNHLYFPIVNILPHTDAQVNIYPSGQPRPGFTYNNNIYYKNNGLQPISGTLTFTKHPTVSIVGISQAGTTATSDGFTYDFTNLAPFEVREIQVALAVPTIPIVSLGDLVTNLATVQVTNDVNPDNNASSITQTIVGSYDPNDKMESHGGKIVRDDFTSNDFLYYTIQFENMGTANAEFVRIEDALDNELDENSFEMLSASHNVNTRREGSSLTWHFYNIDLPPTISDPSGSHGYVSFRIKPKPGYAVGDIIPNTASIYFDYNPAIVTNTFNTEFVQALGNVSFDTNLVVISPNPAESAVNIVNYTQEKISQIIVYDITGKKIYGMQNNTLENVSIDVSRFSRGIYLVELTSESNFKATKKLILK